jgi:hypothetical protein
MSRICVVTAKARAYYSIVTRLRKADIPFVSVVPGSGDSQCDLVLTTRGEADPFGSRAMVVEELDESPSVFRGQILSRMDGGKGTVLVGVDPGSRIGMAAYYADAELGFATFGSIQNLCEGVTTLVRKVPANESLVRIGNGNPPLAMKLGFLLMEELPNATIELVNEAGTSSRETRMKGIQGDQMAAAKIAFRKGLPLKRNPRTHAQ